MKRGLEAATGAPDSQAMRSDDAAKPASEQKDHQRPRNKFVCPPFPKSTPVKIPRAADVLWWTNPIVPVPPPSTVAQKLGDGLAIGIDIETHNWYDEPSKGRTGRFGFWTFRSADFFFGIPGSSRLAGQLDKFLMPLM